jgi:AcrR family transcriptional regulator
MPTTTRERILTGATRLFADNGFVGTSAADIERAAGLKPGSGALFSHFKTKEDVLRTAIEELAAANTRTRAPLESVRLGDLRSEFTLLGRGVLMALDVNRDLVRIWLKENDRFPELQVLMEESVHRPGAEWIARWLSDRVASGDLERHDCEAVGAIALGALTAWWIWKESAGAAGPAVDVDRFVESWVDLLLRLAPRAPHAPTKKRRRD